MVSMTKTCRWCKQSFEITDADLAFYDKISPIFRGQKYQIPAPSLCPSCRQQRRLAVRNERKLYERRCDRCRKEMISIYSPDKGYTVYCKECWWSDAWDPLDFGFDFDHRQSFFAQLDTLQRNVPKLALNKDIGIFSENSEYTNEAGGNKNCYLVWNTGYAQDSYYSSGIDFSRNCVDCLRCDHCEICYECVDSTNLYQCFFSVNCHNCADSYFLKNCQGVKNCFGSINLRNAQYVYMNRQLTRSEYEKNISAILNDPGRIKSFQNEIKSFFLQYPQPHSIGQQNENCVGNYLYHSKNALYCFDSHGLEDCKYCTTLIKRSVNCYDIDIYGDHLELAYEGHCVGTNSYHILFGNHINSSHHLLYCQTMTGTRDCFGCIGLRQKQYCIFNKKYTKEEYESLVPRIIERLQTTSEWGEFFPASLSPFGYNETVAQEYYPLTREQALGSNTREADDTNQRTSVGSDSIHSQENGKIFNWSDYEPPKPRVEKIITASQMGKIPSNIQKVPDEILNWALTCEVSGKLFRIIKPELQFYRQHNLPIPPRHPDRRHEDRMQMRNPKKLWERQCDCNNTSHKHVPVEPIHELVLQNRPQKCLNRFQTTYAPDRPEIVYCEECYLKEMY